MAQETTTEDHHMIVMDFESEAIEGNPILTPPKPIGLAVQFDGGHSHYYDGMKQMDFILRRVVKCSDDWLFQNAPFDLSIIREYFPHIVKPEKVKVHDTQYLIYLHDPHAESLSLKPSYGRILNSPITAKNDLDAWILDNVKGATPKTCGAYICKAPTELVAKYACADVSMTYYLYQFLKPRVSALAYDLERRLAPYLTEATRRGVRVDREELQRQYDLLTETKEKVDQEIINILGAPTLNIDSSAQLADALDLREYVLIWQKTPTGKRSTSRSALKETMIESPLKDLLMYRGELKTCLGTFITSWLALSEKDGRLHPNWTQVKNTRGGGAGTRTGRLASSQPNFQNIPGEFSERVPEGFPPLPKLRDLILPEEGHVWVSRDFSAQEMRILAHFEDGNLAEGFRMDADMDPHKLVQGLIKQKTGVEVTRKQVKNIGFGIMYGMGVGYLSEVLDVPQEEARTLIAAYHAALPGVADLQHGTKSLGVNGMPINTLMGRKYKAETPKVVGGELRSYEYKLLNYLIQGSAADQTKLALLRWFEEKPEGQVFMATVHDEINISVPAGDSHEHLKTCMEQEVMDVPSRTTVAVGENWGDAQ